MLFLSSPFFSLFSWDVNWTQSSHHLAGISSSLHFNTLQLAGPPSWRLGAFVQFSSHSHPNLVLVLASILALVLALGVVSISNSIGAHLFVVMSGCLFNIQRFNAGWMHGEKNEYQMNTTWMQRWKENEWWHKQVNAVWMGSPSNFLQAIAASTNLRRLQPLSASQRHQFQKHLCENFTSSQLQSIRCLLSSERIT